ncbi:MAG: DUF4184 family protein [Anaerolineae bacterium]|nr:DUF4184 family protein [Anaerolineae bacterium]
MQTYSHALINGALAGPLKRRGWQVQLPAFVLGGILPDMPFFLLTVMGEVYYRLMGGTPTGESPMVYMHMTLYFTDLLWIAAHNLLHAPLLLFPLGILGYWAMQRQRRWGAFLLWFALGAGLHAVIDIVTHAGDGPLLFFPLNWTYRFNSPVSYWDPAHYGLIFAPLEHLLDIVLIFVLVKTWRRTRKNADLSAPQ